MNDDRAAATEASQTRRSFDEKWHNNKDLAFRETLTVGSDIQSWILRRNGWENLDGLREYLRPRTRVLDGGCGNGRVSALLRASSDPTTTEIVGIDLVAADVAAENLAGSQNVRFLQKDLLGDLADLGHFDFVYCQEVLHHTADPQAAFDNLVRSCLAPGGEIAIYVYKLKAPVREFTDDHIRSLLSGRSYEEAMDMCREIAAFGKALVDTGVKVTVPEVKALDIPAGEYDVQRLVYHFFMKCFWSPSMTLEENAAINFDWYHPQICKRYRVEEVRAWFARAGLEVVQECVDHYGITMRGLLRPATRP
jgi:SAM-dependent methyltransferase